MLSGTPKLKPPPRLGDKVAVLSGRDHWELELVGWVLNITADLIRIADNPTDDGRPDADEEWFRRTFLLSEVTVIILTNSTESRSK